MAQRMWPCEPPAPQGETGGTCPLWGGLGVLVSPERDMAAPPDVPPPAPPAVLLKWFCGGDVPTEPPPYQLRFRFCWRTSLLNFTLSRPPEAETEPSNPMAPRRRREKAPCSLCREPFKTLLSFKGCGHGICSPCASRLRVGATETCPQCLLVPPGDSDGDEGRSSDGGDGDQRAAKPPKKCPEHGEALEMFCREEGRPVCRRCAVSPTHRTHLTVPIEEAAEEHKVRTWPPAVAPVLLAKCVITSQNLLDFLVWGELGFVGVNLRSCWFWLGGLGGNGCGRLSDMAKVIMGGV